MADAPVVLAGHVVFVCAEDGPRVASEADALDLLGGLWGLEVDWLVLPTARLGEDFLTLRTGLAGAVIQKFVNYRTRLAVVGDISARIGASDALRDFVREANAGGHVWFVQDMAALEARLSAR